MAQHWAIQVGEDGDIWELQRLSNQLIRVKKSERAEWEDAAKRCSRERIGTTDKHDIEIESIGDSPTCPASSAAQYSLPMFMIQQHTR